MSNILFLTSIYNYEEKGNLYTDLVDTLVAHGNTVTVMTPQERKYQPEEKLEEYGSIRCMHFKCLNFRGKVNIIEKGISTLSLGVQYKSKFKRYFDNEKFDAVIYATLPITYSPIVNYVKKKCGAKSYLLQKDFFPQSGVDLGIMRKDSIPYKFFRGIEKKLFECSDKIGVISPKNVEFFRENNPDIDPNKVEYCPNSIIPSSEEKLATNRASKNDIRKKYNIPVDAVVFIYGGVISRAQGVDFIKSVFSELNKENLSDAYFILIGSGNGYDDLSNHIKLLGMKNVVTIPFMPKKEFDEILAAADIGMVFLDNRFTIANIPSRTLAHLDYGQPIIAATDGYTDYRALIEDNKIGLWCLSNRPKKMVENIKRMTNDHDFREHCGKNARKLLLREYSTEVTYNVMKKSLDI